MSQCTGPCGQKTSPVIIFIHHDKRFIHLWGLDGTHAHSLADLLCCNSGCSGKPSSCKATEVCIECGLWMAGFGKRHDSSDEALW